MADIKQAAKWLSQGCTVRRKQYADKYWVSPWEPKRISYDVVCYDGGEHTLDVFDLQAEDWEIAE